MWDRDVKITCPCCSREFLILANRVASNSDVPSIVILPEPEMTAAGIVEVEVKNG